MQYRIFELFISILLVVFQISFLPSLPQPLASINGVLIALVLILMLSNIEKALAWSIVCGLLIDIHSVYIFGLYTFIYTSMTFLTYILLNNFFTNKSIYSFFSLVALGTLAFVLVQTLTFLIIGTISRDAMYAVTIDMIYIKDFFRNLFANIAITLVAFYTVNYFSKKFKPFFIVRRHI